MSADTTKTRQAMHAAAGNAWVFYSGPCMPRGQWIRSHMSTAVVTYPICKSEKWEPCKFSGRHVASTHWERRKAASNKTVTTCSGCGK